MSEVTLIVDVPKRMLSVPKTPRWTAFKEEVKTRYLIDLSYYDVETDSQSIPYPVRSQQDYEIAMSKGKVALQAKLQDYSKPTCLLCRKSFSNKRTFEEHFKECSPPAGVEDRRSSAGRETTSARPMLQNFVVQRKSAGLVSLLAAL
jgi:hypothetical protein